MDVIRISGRTYPARPTSRGCSAERVRRLRSIVLALKYASEECSEMERRLYKSILEVRAHAENLVDEVAGQRLPDPLLSDLQSAVHEP